MFFKGTNLDTKLHCAILAQDCNSCDFAFSICYLAIRRDVSASLSTGTFSLCIWVGGFLSLLDALHKISFQTP